MDTRLISFNFNRLDSKPDIGNSKGQPVSKVGRRRSSIMVGNPNLMATHVVDRIDHIPSISLQPSLRVGFSVLNLTGQPIRYLQQWEGGKRTVQYLNTGERGLLNIVAAQTLIRNGRVVEETFEVQQEQLATVRSRSHKKMVGNRVALQVAGYRWLHSVQADELGVQFEELFPILGRVDATRVFKEERIAYSLKLMVEVLPFCGGRMLRLRSVFSVKNNTKHRLQILAKKGAREWAFGNDESSVADPNDDNEEAPSLLNADEEMYLPIALLYQSIIASQGHSLGVLFLKPADLRPIEEELESRLELSPGHIDYSTDPINLFQLAAKGSERVDGAQAESNNDRGDESGVARSMQLCCHVHPKQKVRHGRRFGGKQKAGGAANTPNGEASEKELMPPSSGTQTFSSNKLPPFCYSVEIIRDIPTKKLKEVNGRGSTTTDPRSFTIGNAVHCQRFAFLSLF